MPKPPGQQKNVSVNSFQTGLAACFSVCVLCACVFVCDTSSHVKSTGCFPHYVTQLQQIRAQIWKKCELIITSDWLGLEQSWGHLLCDWLELNSVENLPLPFPSIPAVQRDVTVCVYVHIQCIHMQYSARAYVLTCRLTRPSVQCCVKKHRLPHPTRHNTGKLRSAFMPVFMRSESW